jgi:exodeoxyribonuclease VII small subunit
VNQTLSYEQARDELAEVVRKLESGGLSLDDAVALWERGEELYRLCRAQLDVAQGKVEELAARVESAKPTTAPSPD